MKKWILGAAFFLAVISAVCICALPTQVKAAVYEKLTYEVRDGEVNITDCSESVSGKVTIPDSIDGNPVTAIGGSAFRNCEDMTDIVIPAGVTWIGENAFSGCSGLTNVYFAGDLTQWCGITFDANPMMYADKLYLGGRQPSGYVTIPDGVTTIPHGTFKNCSNLYSVTIPNSVTTIEWRAFQNCNSLTTVNFGTGLKEIGGYAFYSCTSLTTVSVPNGVTVIEEAAFSGCAGLRSVSIPNSVTTIGINVFADCGNLSYNTYDNAKYLGNAGNPYLLLYKSVSNSITQCEIHPDTKLTSNSVFFGCANLESIVIPEGVLSINSIVFGNCTSLKSITIPKSVTSIGSNAFQNCSKLDHVLYTGTQEQWNAITIGSSNNYLTGAIRHYDCTGEEIQDGVCLVCNPPVALGDADGDGFIDAFDASLVNKYSVGTVTADELNVEYLDVDGDGYVDAYDASLIQKRSVGTITKFPAEEKT